MTLLRGLELGTGWLFMSLITLEQFLQGPTVYIGENLRQPPF